MGADQQLKDAAKLRRAPPLEAIAGTETCRGDSRQASPETNTGAWMRDNGGRTFLSATDLMRFMGCAHATTLDLARMRGTGPEPREDTEDAALLQKQGDAHEAEHLQKLKRAGRSIVKIDRGSLAADAERTRPRWRRGRTSSFRGLFFQATGAAGPTFSNAWRNPRRSAPSAMKLRTPSSSGARIQNMCFSWLSVPTC